MPLNIEKCISKGYIRDKILEKIKFFKKFTEVLGFVRGFFF